MARSYDLGLARASWVASKHGLLWQPVVSHEVKGTRVSTTAWCSPVTGLNRVPPFHWWTRLTKWSMVVGQMSWVACDPMVAWCFPCRGVPGCLSPQVVQINWVVQVNWVACGYGYRWPAGLGGM